MENTINTRFKRLIDEVYGGNKRAFASAVGVSATVVENVVGARQGKPSYDVIVKLCANANISPGWLLTGEGSMLRDGQPAPMGAPSTVIYERDPRDVELITMQRDMISTQNELIAALKRERGSDPSGFSARAVGFTPPPSTPPLRK